MVSSKPGISQRACRSYFQRKKLNRYLFKKDYKDPIIGTGVSPSTEDYLRTSGSKKYLKMKWFKFRAIVRSALASYGKAIFKSSTSKENKNAILECVANDIAIASGMNCQEQSLVFGKYDNGDLKIMTRCGWEDGISDLGKIRGNEKIGVNVSLKQDNYQPVLGGSKFKEGRYFVKEGPDGVMISDNSIPDLAEQLALILAQGDRDVLGSKGANKNSVKGKFFGIDFGHAYRGKNPLVDSLQDDFSITQPKAVFKNLSAFYDNSLAEKMKGLHYLNKLVRGIEPSPAIMEQYDEAFRARMEKIEPKGDVKIFNNYIRKFDELRKDAIKNDNPKQAEEYHSILEGILKAKQSANEANMKILEVFDKRIHLTPAQLDILETFEKISSKTSLRASSSKDSNIILQCARVEKRVKWDMKSIKIGNVKKCVLTSNTNGKSSKKKLMEFVASMSISLQKLELEHGFQINLSNNGINVSFNDTPECRAQVTAIFNEINLQKVRHLHDFNLRNNTPTLLHQKTNDKPSKPVKETRRTTPKRHIASLKQSVFKHKSSASVLIPANKKIFKKKTANLKTAFIKLAKSQQH